jgi:hypothetical protein
MRSRQCQKPSRTVERPNQGRGDGKFASRAVCRWLVGPSRPCSRNYPTKKYARRTLFGHPKRSTLTCRPALSWKRHLDTCTGPPLSLVLRGKCWGCCQNAVRAGAPNDTRCIAHGGCYGNAYGGSLQFQDEGSVHAEAGSTFHESKTVISEPENKENV